jgi:hypothetical protein
MQCRVAGTIAKLIERTISIDALPKDVTLVARLRGDSILPIDALLCHQRLVSCHPTEEQLLIACGQIANLRILYNPDPCIVLPFFVEATVLIISNPDGAKQAEFRAFLTSLLGHSFFEVHPYDRCFFKVRFADKPTAISLWRALQYSPFRGQFLSVSPMPSLVKATDIGPIRPAPKRLKNDGRVQQKKKLRERMQKAAATRTDGNHPAALPMAMLIGTPEVPQAVLLESQTTGLPGGRMP